MISLALALRSTTVRGPSRLSIPGELVTEEGDPLITEDGNYISLEGVRYFITEAMDSLTTESDLSLKLE